MQDFSSDRCAIYIKTASVVTLVRSNVTRNTIASEYTDSAVISVNFDDNVLRLEETRVSGNTARHQLLVDSSSYREQQIFSDVKKDLYFTNDYATLDATSPLSQAPADKPGIGLLSPWFLGVQQVCST